MILTNGAAAHARELERVRTLVERLTRPLATTAHFARCAGVRYASIAVALSAQSGMVWRPDDVEIALIEYVRRYGPPPDRRTGRHDRRDR